MVVRISRKKHARRGAAHLEVAGDRGLRPRAFLDGQLEEGPAPRLRGRARLAGALEGPASELKELSEVILDIFVDL